MSCYIIEIISYVMIVSFIYCLEFKFKFGRYYLGMVGWNIVFQVENYVKVGI